jgi:4a-hydroxytetrahydrobiopterin dehydratase
MVDDALPRRVAADLPGWRIDGEELAATWKFPDFATALAAAVRVGMLAEHADHHPDLELGWGRLAVRLTTHSAGRITDKDVDLAAAMSAALGRPADR